MTSTEPTYGERNWRDRAACRGLDPEMFFPVQETDDCAPALTEQVRAAKAVCARCPVRESCLAQALRRMPYGIAGGLTATERRQFYPGVRPEPEHRMRRRTDGTSRAENRQEGLRALRAGHTPEEVVEICQVSQRTVARWAAEVHAQIPQPRHEVEGSAAATAAPLRISRSHDLLRTRITEGHRV